MTSLPSIRTYIHMYAIPHFYCARVCFGGKLHGLPLASVWREVACCCPRLFGGKLHRQLRFTKKNIFSRQHSKMKMNCTLWQRYVFNSSALDKFAMLSESQQLHVIHTRIVPFVVPRLARSK